MDATNGTNMPDNESIGNEQHKAAGIPTLMITVKNEIAQSTNEQAIPTTGEIKMTLSELVQHSFPYARCS